MVNNDHPVIRFVLPTIGRFGGFVLAFQIVSLIVKGKMGADSGEMLLDALMIAALLTLANYVERV